MTVLALTSNTASNTAPSTAPIFRVLKVARILSSRVQSLAVCRMDSAVKGLEPENPLK